MRKIKIFSLLFLFSILCSSVFAESKKGEIKEFFKEYKEMVSEHIEDLDYLSKSESSFRKYSENHKHEYCKT